MKDRVSTASEPEIVNGVTIKCKYVGGHSALGKHGHHFRIKDGQLGHGELSLTHSIPLSDVVSVVIAQRGVDNQEGPPITALLLVASTAVAEGSPRPPKSRG